ncbi:MAG: (d)CMP kinase [Leptospiraceae bacterium]|nr:(d)CMP kinase [Leptospiraceae bacterium]
MGDSSVRPWKLMRLMDSNEKYVIALDGPAGSGKSSVAGILARKLGCIHADSGAMYRLLTLAAMRQLGEAADHTAFGTLFQSSLDQLTPADLGCSVQLGDKGQQINCINGQDVGEQIRTLAVTARIRYIASERSFRDQVNQMLRDLAQETSLIVDGRDIGSIVFPDTAWKFYLDASARVRARRRLLELREKGKDQGISAAELEAQIEERDAEDRTRPFGALQIAPGAKLIDTSSMSRNDVVQVLLSHLQIKF